jgi:hypothetical protein
MKTVKERATTQGMADGAAAAARTRAMQAARASTMESKSTEASIQAHIKRDSGRQALRFKKELSSTLSAREEHPSKVLSPMLVRDAGSSLSAREEHPRKA